ncbi:DUF3221 domain-containing protein [Bacillus sp. ISL-45]|uniref:DUF3221 domain-containing protein n=1 Tax=Bacillus sp. ISL-45 TaxID=2819128 RepID=UPI001BE90EB1|nr:DUF3221 domain-containing protein [Bacillus sp. ISL-45]MBT2661725.1 DUF3221 domain-containing protein [Bacillus sp. ISL-45]
MRRHHVAAALLGVAITISGCGPTDKDNHGFDKAAGTPVENTLPANESGWKTIEVVNNRAIIAKLKQTAKETPERNKKIEETKERQDFKDGLFGKPTEELAEALTMQAIEGTIAPQALERLYGGYKALEDNMVIFLENSNQNGERMGFWIGVKKADDRLTKFLQEMQTKVDAGEIKAEYIHIFYSPYTTTENYDLTTKVYETVKRIHRLSGYTSGNHSSHVDTVTGEVVIGHNFLSEEEKNQIIKQLPERKVVFEQRGRMIPKEGEPDTFYPEKEFTDQPSKEGDYIMQLSKDGLLAVSAQGRVYNKATGELQFGATHFSFPEAAKKLKIGQRVEVEADGPIMESYPGQGGALYVTVLPEYKPAGANMSESQVIRKAMTEAKKTSGDELLIIRDISFNPEASAWTVNFQYGFQGQELEINIAE